jgi:hypothetical protein
MLSRKNTLTPKLTSKDAAARANVDDDIWKAFQVAQKKLQASSYTGWSVDLYPRGSKLGGAKGAVKYRHEPCSALYSVSNLSKIAGDGDTRHKCATVCACPSTGPNSHNLLG